MAQYWAPPGHALGSLVCVDPRAISGAEATVQPPAARAAEASTRPKPAVTPISAIPRPGRNQRHIRSSWFSAAGVAGGAVAQVPAEHPIACGAASSPAPQGSRSAAARVEAVSLERLVS